MVFPAILDICIYNKQGRSAGSKNAQKTYSVAFHYVEKHDDPQQELTVPSARHHDAVALSMYRYLRNMYVLISGG